MVIEEEKKSDWTHADFQNLTLPNEVGEMVHWMEAYYTWSYGRMPLLTREFIDTYYYDLPVVLLHGMVVSCLQETTRESIDFEPHARILNDYVLNTIKNPTIYTLISVYYSAGYLYAQQKTIKAAAYMGLGIRICHELELHLRNDVPVYSAKNPKKQIDLQMTKKLMTTAWLVSYIQDFYYQGVTGMPFCTHSQFSSDLLKEYRDTKLDPLKADKYFSLTIVIFITLYI
jgi:hypothetical protein